MKTENCVEPHSTKIKIRFKKELSTLHLPAPEQYIQQEISLADFSLRFINNDDFRNPEYWEINPEFEVQVLSKYIIQERNEEDKIAKERQNYVASFGYDKYKAQDVWMPILTFFVKNRVKRHFTDGKISVSPNHIFIDPITFEETKAKKHIEFKQVPRITEIVDIEVGGTHNYYANGRLNHNSNVIL